MGPTCSSIDFACMHAHSLLCSRCITCMYSSYCDCVSTRLEGHACTIYISVQCHVYNILKNVHAECSLHAYITV